MHPNRTYFPPIRDVACDLRDAKRMIGKGEEMEVRLQVLPDGSWTVLTGDPSYDLDHRGYWGCGYLTKQTNCLDLARELVWQAKDHASQC